MGTGRVTDINGILHEPVAGADDGKGLYHPTVHCKKGYRFFRPQPGCHRGDGNKLI